MNGNDDMYEDFKKLSRLDRRYVVFVEDDRWQEVVGRVADRENGMLSNDIRKMLNLAARYPMMAFLSSSVALIMVAGAIVAVINRRYSATKVNILPSSLSNKYKLPPAGAELRHVYVLDPVRDDVYHSFEEFHKYVLRYKHKEYYEMLVGLGAIKITERYITGEGMELGLGVKVVSESSKEEGSGKIEGNRKTNARREIITTFGRRGVPPKEPTGLKWYSYEPSWQECVHSRVHGHCTKLTTKFDYTSDYGVTASMRGSFKDVGFKVGTTFKRYESVVAEVEIIFEEV